MNPVNMGILFVSFVLWMHRLYKNNKATIITFNSNDAESSDVLCDVLTSRLPSCGPCDNTAVRISIVPRSQVMAALSYFAYSSIGESFNWFDTSAHEKQLAGELTLAVSPEYIWAITSQCACKGFINDQDSKLERVLDYYSSISTSFSLQSADSKFVLQNNIASAKYMLLSVDYPKGKLVDAFMLCLLLLCGGIVPSLFMVTVCSMLRRAYTTRRRIYKMVGPNLSTCKTVDASSLFNSKCPICWSEWSDIITAPTAASADKEEMVPSSPCSSSSSKCVVALQCGHALCRDCLTTMELTKLGDYCLSGGLERDAVVAVATATSTVLTTPTSAANSGGNSGECEAIRCPCCCRQTPYSGVRRVLV